MGPDFQKTQLSWIISVFLGSKIEYFKKVWTLWEMLKCESVPKAFNETSAFMSRKEERNGGT